MAQAPDPKQQVVRNWMPVPQTTISGCPPGLEYLTQIDQLLVHQQVRAIAKMISWRATEKRYRICNALGQDIYLAAEQSNYDDRQYWGPLGPLVMSIADSTQREVIHLKHCSCCLCFCCLQHIEVQSPPGSVIGYIDEDFSLTYPWFSIKDATRETQLKIRGFESCCELCSQLSEAEFEVLSADGTRPVGKITKQWSGLSQANKFGIQFPMDLDVKMKAVMLGACFLVDFMFFQQENDQMYREDWGIPLIGTVVGLRSLL